MGAETHMSNTVLGDFVNQYQLRNRVEVQVFRNGMLLPQKDETLMVLWEEIQITQRCPQNPLNCLKLRLRNQQIIEIALPKKSDAPLIDLIEYQVAKRQIPAFFNELKNGNILNFGAVKVSQFGVELRGHKFAWSAFEWVSLSPNNSSLNIFNNIFPMKEYATSTEKITDLYTLILLVNTVREMRLWLYAWDVNAIQQSEDEDRSFPGVLSSKHANPKQIAIATLRSEVFARAIAVVIFIGGSVIAFLGESWLLTLIAAPLGIMSLYGFLYLMPALRIVRSQKGEEIVTKAIVHRDKVELTTLISQTVILKWEDAKSLELAEAGYFIEDLAGKRFDIGYLESPTFEEDYYFFLGNYSG